MKFEKIFRILCKEWKSKNPEKIQRINLNYILGFVHSTGFLMTTLIMISDFGRSFLCYYSCDRLYMNITQWRDGKDYSY